MNGAVKVDGKRLRRTAVNMIAGDEGWRGGSFKKLSIAQIGVVIDLNCGCCWEVELVRADKNLTGAGRKCTTP